MLPVNPWLPLTDRVMPVDVPRATLPFMPPVVRLNEEPLDPNRDPLPIADELPKCEPSRFETARFGAIDELRPNEDPAIPLRPLEAPDIEVLEEVLEADPPPKFPACEFDAVIELLELDPRDAPAALPPACVPAVLPVLRELAPELFRALLVALALPPPLALAPPPLPFPNECQCPSAFAELAAPRPAGQPDVRAFSPFDPERDAPFVALRPAPEAELPPP